MLPPGESPWIVLYYRAMLCIRGAIAMALCPSVRLSVECTRLLHIGSP